MAGAQKRRSLLALVPLGHEGAREDGAVLGLLRPSTTEQGAQGQGAEGPPCWGLAGRGAALPRP